MNMNTSGDKELFAFLVNAPKEFREGEKIKKFQLKNGDYIHCILWNMHFYITGTDIVKILLWRFQNAGRQLTSIKKFEEGVFSDLRNLKPGIDATLEGPRSDFLEFLYKNGCIRTQKKQKVFYWYSVPHDALFCDALERDLRRETNLYTYSKYMNNLASHNYVDGINPYQMQSNNPYIRNANITKKKNTVKVSSRLRRSPKDYTVNTAIMEEEPSMMAIPKNNDTGILPPLTDQIGYLDYDAFNPTLPDPFLSFGSGIPDYSLFSAFDPCPEIKHTNSTQMAKFHHPLKKPKIEENPYGTSHRYSPPENEETKEKEQGSNKSNKKEDRMGSGSMYHDIPNNPHSKSQK